MKFKHKEKNWVIMTKDRTMIAKGNPRNRWMVRVDDKKDRKRILTYKSKTMAEMAFSYGNGFYCDGPFGDLESVEVDVSICEVR